MDIVRHLRFFVAVAEEGHFGDAAARLEMTQPPVSQGLRRLEQELGVQLLRRTSRGAELTDAGRELLPRARLLIDDAGRFLGEARRLRTGSDAVRWGAVSHVGHRATAAVSRRLADSTTAQHMRSASATALVDAVVAGALDLAVVETPCVTGRLHVGPVVRFDRVVVVAADHPMATAKRPRLRQLDGMSLCLPPRSANPPAHDQLLDRFGEAGLEPRPLVVTGTEEVIAAVASGTAFALSIDRDMVAGIEGLRAVSVGLDVTALRLRVIHRADDLTEIAEIVTAALWRAARARDEG